MGYHEYFFRAKYHLSVVRRMMGNYLFFPDKRVLVGVINESARGASSFIKACFVFGGFSGRDLIEGFRKFSMSHLRPGLFEDIMILLEIERAQKSSLVEFQKGDKIIFFTKGKYKILLVDRLNEFVNSLEEAIKAFDRIIYR